MRRISVEDSDRGLDPARIANEIATGAKLIVDPNQNWSPVQLEKHTSTGGNSI